MGSNAASSGGGSNRYEPPKKKNPIVEFIKTGGITGAVVRGIGKGIETIKKNYNIRKTNESLLGSADYQGGKTLSGSIVRTNDNDKSNNNANVSVPLIPITQSTTIASSPTTAEVSQSTATDAAEYDLRKTKKKGRSMTILTSSRGVKPDDTLTLGKKSLLGS
tara:strand:+ start:280 stop:768 length:489 start_codon:yes stop_codon:yes gene_type:complete